MCTNLAVAIQVAQDRVFLFIEYRYLDKTEQETRKRPKNSELICAKLKPGNHRGFLRSRVRYYCKSLDILIACIFLSISSRRLDIVRVLQKTQIWDKLEAILLFSGGCSDE